MFNHDDYVLCDIPSNEFKAFVKNGYFETESLATEGFIHCAKPSQMPYVMNKYFTEDSYFIFVSHKLMLEDDLKYEGKDPDNLFPHLYRRFNREDAILFFEVKRNDNGKFELPSTLF